MKQLAWFFLGGLVCLLVQFFLFAGGDRRVELALGPEGGNGKAAETSWGIEMKLVHQLDTPAEPTRAQASGVQEERRQVEAPRESDRLLDSNRWRIHPDDGARRIASGSERRRPITPAPRPKWTQEPELAEYYNNGQLHFRALQVQDEKGTWVREGPWEAWHENGQLHESGAYLRGREQGKWSWWYDNGQSMANGEFVEGARTGSWTFWHENGSVMMEGKYSGGKGSGRWTHYDEGGSAVKYVEFVDGEVRQVEWL